MARKLFCEINPLTYRISRIKGIFLRKLKWIIDNKRYINTFNAQKLSTKIYKHKSLIRRQLGDVDMRLQENKAINLNLAAPQVNNIIIKPGEIFSFWKLVGNCTEKKGYKEGLVIKSGRSSKGIGGGLCQFTNLIHWMVLHSPLEIIEHHHHNQIDMFPDYGRQVPFGTGTSILYNYLDYQFVNNTDQEFQLITYTTEKYLCGELRSERSLKYSYHIVEENNHFVKEGDTYYRKNEIYRKIIDKRTGKMVKKELIKKNCSKVLYDSKYIPIEMISSN
ncbi:VanW family protein [Sporosalibacterium faouarense]|uniref:VanW family protein n=1 Tax=Sporosalibacterium faouarense TaxID=516123 RepID=UPI00192B6A92|nr:VanW family protein [Sporosalibacterium faouarense]